MANSFTVSGQSCDVGTLLAREKSGDSQSAWKDFCDCMFLAPTERITYLCNGGPIVGIPPAGNFMSEAQRAALAQQVCARMGGKYSVQVDTVLSPPDDNWAKCQSKFCALPGGCDHPYIPGLKMPFNIGVGILASPWTDAGSVARGIPMRNASAWSTVFQLTTIDPSDYAPLALWKTYFQNPSKYYLLAAKINLLPVVGSVISGIMAQPMPAGVIPLGAAALAQCAAEGKSVYDSMFLPALQGEISNIGFVVNVLGPVLGAQYFDVAGQVVQKAASDQVSTGEIDKVQDPATRAFIEFFASNGAEIGHQLQRAIGGNVDSSTLSGVFQACQTGFTALSKDAKFSTTLRGLFASIATLMRTLQKVSSTFEQAAPGAPTPFAVTNAVMQGLFGLGLSDITLAVQQGQAATQKLLAASGNDPNATIGDTLNTKFAAIDGVFRNIANVLSNIKAVLGQFGGFLDGFVKPFDDFSAVMPQVQAAVAQVAPQLVPGLAAAHGLGISARPAAGLVAASSRLGTKLPSPLPPRTQPPLPPRTQPQPPLPPPSRTHDGQGTVVGTSGHTGGRSDGGGLVPSTSSAKGQGVYPLVGGVVGAFLGGPIGAAVGAAAGVALAPKARGLRPGSSQSQMAGFGLTRSAPFISPTPFSPAPSASTRNLRANAVLNAAIASNLSRIGLPSSGGRLLGPASTASETTGSGIIARALTAPASPSIVDASTPASPVTVSPATSSSSSGITTSGDTSGSGWTWPTDSSGNTVSQDRTADGTVIPAQADPNAMGTDIHPVTSSTAVSVAADGTVATSPGQLAPVDDSTRATGLGTVVLGLAGVGLLMHFLDRKKD